MDWRDHIVQNPDILAGKPSIRGTRISVDLLLRITAAGWTTEQILNSYPQVAEESLRAVYAYAADVLSGEAHLADA